MKYSSTYNHRVASKKRLLQKLRPLVGVCLFLVGGYILILTLSPTLSHLPSALALSPTLNVTPATATRDRIQIAKLNLTVPYASGNASQLQKGAWWRYPDRGNPEIGGNFILSAHRFYLGLTPQKTLERSPFYHLDTLKAGDDIKIFYNHKGYDYKVTKNYHVDRTAVGIEDTSKEAKLTLYTCSLGGEIDGRVVIEAKLQS